MTRAPTAAYLAHAAAIVRLAQSDTDAADAADLLHEARELQRKSLELIERAAAKSWSVRRAVDNRSVNLGIADTIADLTGFIDQLAEFGEIA